MKFYGKNCSTCSAKLHSEFGRTGYILKGNGRKVKQCNSCFHERRNKRREILRLNLPFCECVGGKFCLKVEDLLMAICEVLTIEKY